jgi:hypothetical protein
MPTKAQLEEQIAQMYSDMGHQRRAYEDQQRECEDRIADLACENSRLRGAIRPFFMPAGSDVHTQTGTAHCPVCGAVAPATLRYSIVMSHYIVATARPIDHKPDCIFAEKHGLTPLQSENCDDGDKGCPECPWKDLPNYVVKKEENDE